MMKSVRPSYSLIGIGSQRGGYERKYNLIWQGHSDKYNNSITIDCVDCGSHIVMSAGSSGSWHITGSCDHYFVKPPIKDFRFAGYKWEVYANE